MEKESAIAIICSLFALILAFANFLPQSYTDLEDLPDLFEIGDIPNIDLQHGLCLWLPFDGVALDKSGYGLNGVVENGTYQTGIFDRAINFTGNGYVQVSDNPLLGVNEFFICCWVSFNDSLGYRNILRKVGANWVDYGLYLTWNSHQLYVAVSDTDNNLYELGSTYALNVGDVCWVAGYYDGSVFGIYINNTLDNSYQLDITIKQSGFDFYVGSHAGSSQFFDGWVDDVRIYNRALSGYEISYLYNLNS